MNQFYIITIVLIKLIYGQQRHFPDCQSGPLSPYPICNSSLSYHVRAQDLISHMTIDEKISQMVTRSPSIDHLGIPAYIWWSEALHGLAFCPGVQFGGDLPSATSFPMPLNLGATFNMKLVYDIGQIISTEAPTFNNYGQAGLTYFTPNINIFRDPRWGRGQETPGEDPYLTSQYVYSIINGLQNGDDSKYLKIAASCKHFNAYDLENWNGTDCFSFNAVVTDQDLVETYLPPFETCIRDARVAGIMCSHNAINGIPSCANKFHLRTLARHAYHLNGFIVSDCGAIDNIMGTHHYTSTVQDTVAVALHAGTSLDCGDFYSKHSKDALLNGTISEQDIDKALQWNYETLLRLGWFDPPEQQVYRQYTKEQVNTKEAQQLALKSAQESIVLLKNNNGPQQLPINLNKLSGKRIGLIGPTANATILQQGNYYGQAPYIINPIEGFEIVTKGTNVSIEFAFGCSVSDTDESGFQQALDVAHRSDYIFFFGGLNQSIEAEARDRTSITLPDIQVKLIQQLEQMTEASLHVVIMSGSGLDLSFIRDSSAFTSLLWMGYAGQSGGLAVATVIFGLYNPSGKLPITFYPQEYVNQVPMTDMSMRSSPINPGRTYKFYIGQPVYEFGYGLSYTTFKYEWCDSASSSIFNIEHLMTNHYDDRFIIQTYRVNVTNTGTRDGDDVVLAYLKPELKLIKNVQPPLKQLFGFTRIHLSINETIQVYFPLNIRSLLTIGSDGSKWLHQGQYHLHIGKQQQSYTVKLYGKSSRWN